MNAFIFLFIIQEKEEIFVNAKILIKKMKKIGPISKRVILPVKMQEFVFLF